MLELSLLEGVVVAATPLIPLFFPGVFFVGKTDRAHLLLRGARVLTISLIFGTLVSFLLAFFGISVAWMAVVMLLASGVGIWAQRRTILSWENRWQLLTLCLPVLIVYAVFSVPFLLAQDGLPTGDSQKAVFWGQEILTFERLPDYQRSVAHLNRDPVDFYTPGLHALTATIMRFSPQPLTSIGLFSIAIGAGVALLGAALARELFPQKKYIYVSAIAALLILTNLRFLRYLREPGYHYQNVLGEFFLFALVLFTLRLLKKWRWADAAVAAACGITLIITHQFSAFIGAFFILVLGTALLIRYTATIRSYLWHHVTAGIAAAGALVAGVGFAVGIGLHQKIPHLFTTDPHLASLSPTLLNYPNLMGAVWFTVAIIGLLLLAAQFRGRAQETLQVRTFVALCAVILLLSQGPRLFIDIPPVRALFYAVVPFSIAGAFAFAQLFLWIRKVATGLGRAVLLSAWVALLVVPAGVSAYSALTSTSRAVRTNSTLGAEQIALIDYIRGAANNPTEAILTDDYNRRSTSWLLLANQPMYARIAADLERQMDESRQSPARYGLYLGQLDYEKIFSLGSRPELVHLMRKHNIRWVTGIEGSSESSLRNNPQLTAAAQGDQATIFEAGQGPACPADSTCAWLLRASTIVNDIGDKEDTFLHLPASLRTTRLSEPHIKEQQTFRVTSAPYIQLSFNIGDYVRVLWDKERTGRPDTALELHIALAGAPASDLSIIAPSGSEFHMATSESTIQIPALDVLFDEDGFATFTIRNPQEQEIAIDLIALGLARVP